MEIMWQQKGFESFGEWRNATERARKAAKRQAAAAAAAPALALAPAVALVEQPAVDDAAPEPEPINVRISWQCNTLQHQTP